MSEQSTDEINFSSEDDKDSEVSINISTEYETENDSSENSSDSEQKQKAKIYSVFEDNIDNSDYFIKPLEKKSNIMQSLSLISIEKIHSYIDSDINNFLSLWIKIDLPEGIVNENTLIQIKTYLLGIGYIVEKYSTKSLQNAFTCDKIALTTGIYTLFSFILNQNEIGSKIQREKYIVENCIDIEMSFLQKITLILKKTANIKQIIYGDNRILGCMFKSINSTNQSARICSLHILKLLLKNTSFHHLILTSLKQLSQKYSLPYKILYLTQHYEKDDQGSKYNELLTSIFQIILKSKSPSPSLDSWKEEIKEHCAHLISDIKTTDENEDVDNLAYWKNKYFNLQNDSYEIKEMKAKIKEHEEDMANMKKYLEKSVENEKNATDQLNYAFDYIKEMKKALLSLKSMCKFDEVKIDEAFYQKLKVEFEEFKRTMNTLNENQTSDENLSDDSKAESEDIKKCEKSPRIKFKIWAIIGVCVTLVISIAYKLL